MASNPFTHYGIKEVANVQFYALSPFEYNGTTVPAGNLALYIDTAKVSTLEQTAEQTDARGGWGNNKLITWDYNKEENFTLEDALCSMESLRFMLGGKMNVASTTSKVTVKMSSMTTATVAGTADVPTDYDVSTGAWWNYGQGTQGLGAAPTTGVKKGDKILFTWDEERDGATDDTKATEVIVSASEFPGAYKIVCDGKIRSQDTLADELFQIVFNKAKVAADVTITMQAEGDPSTFSMNITVLKDDDGNLCHLIKY